MESYICPRCEVGLVNNGKCLGCKAVFGTFHKQLCSENKKPKKRAPTCSWSDVTRIPKEPKSINPTSWMFKKKKKIISLVLLAPMFSSCVSIATHERSKQENYHAGVLAGIDMTIREMERKNHEDLDCDDLIFNLKGYLHAEQMKK